MQVCASVIVMDEIPTLHTAYGMKSDTDLDALYRKWAHAYDMGFSEAQGYQLPAVVARAFIAAGGAGPVLDVGAGTGLLGEHLAAAGVTDIDGVDLSGVMLSVARSKQIYRDLYTGSVNVQLNLPDYAGFVSAGAFTLGHVGPQAIGNLLAIASKGANFVISVNTVHYADAGFAAYFDGLGAAIAGLTLVKCRIYDDRADADHRDDTAFIVTFTKA